MEARIPWSEVLFQDGNWEDFWLGQPPGTNSFIMGGPATELGLPGWTSIEEVLRHMRAHETMTWTPQRDLVLSLLKHDTERGGGIQGATPELQRYRSSLLSRGRKALEWERRIGRA